MKLFKLLATSTLMLTVAASCSKKDAEETANNIKEDASLAGVYSSPCSKSSLLGMASQNKLTFAGNKFTKEELFFEKEDCSGAADGSSLVLKGTFVVKGDTLPNSDARPIKVELTEAYIQPKSDFFVNLGNTSKFCGHSDYAKDQKTVITTQTDNLLCPVQSVPSTLFGAYRVEGNKLYLNAGDISKMTTKESDQPSKLDKSVVYSR